MTRLTLTGPLRQGHSSVTEAANRLTVGVGTVDATVSKGAKMAHDHHKGQQYRTERAKKHGEASY
jgi:uncharacterized protein (UPF0332 family)